MLSSIPIKTLVVVALVHFSPAFAHATAEQVDGNSLLAPRAPSTHQHRRSIDLGRSTRLHRSRRRRSTALPKPYGTDGAATTDEENIKLLEKYVAHQSEVNTAWQKQANADILAGKTAIQYDEFADNYDGHPHHSTEKKKEKMKGSDDNDDDSEEQCEADTRKPAGERGPTLMDKAREKARKKAAKEALNKDTGASLGQKGQDGDDTYGAKPADKGLTKHKDEHKVVQNNDQGKSQSQSSKSASKNNAERQKVQQEQQDQKAKEEQQKQQQQKEKEQEKQKEEQQKKEETQRKEAEKQQKEKAKQDAEAQKQKEDAQKQKQKEEHKQLSPKPASGPLAQYLGQVFSGDMTYYDVGLDSCGWTDKVEGHTVAVAQSWFDKFSGGDDNPNHNSICGKKIKIYKNGKEEHATITDTCPRESSMKCIWDKTLTIFLPACTEGSIDMSQSLFESLENLDVGRCNVKWEFINE